MSNIIVQASVVNFIRHGESTWNEEGKLQGQGEEKVGLSKNQAFLS
jgi:broad specificity phosphatase PhoE